MASQVALAAAVQAQLLAVATLKIPLLVPAPNEAFIGETV